MKLIMMNLKMRLDPDFFDIDMADESENEEENTVFFEDEAEWWNFKCL